MPRFNHPVRRLLVIKMSGSRKCHFAVRSSLFGTRFGNATIVYSDCLMKNANVFEKGEMGQAGEKWDKMWREVGQMRLGLLSK